LAKRGQHLLQEKQELSSQPIFIIGAARSGTKFLRDCLRGDPRICAVPYDVNYIWRYKQPNSIHDVLPPQTLKPEQSAFIRKTIAQQASLSSEGILLEKTVSNSLRVPFVEAIYPGARYIHLIRDGRNVAESAMRQWQAPPDYKRLLEKLKRLPLASLPYLFWFLRKSVLGSKDKNASNARVWGPRYPGIEKDVEEFSLAKVCAVQWRKSIEYALDDFKVIPSDRICAIRYEDLIGDPASIVKLAEALQLDASAIGAKWEATINPTRERPLSDAQKIVRAEIEDVLRPTLQSLGYTVETAT
jgi:hypothetical protein